MESKRGSEFDAYQSLSQRSIQSRFLKRVTQPKRSPWAQPLAACLLITSVLLFVGVQQQAQAGELHGVLHGISKHATDADRNGKPWNEANLGLGLRYAYSAELSVQSGVYYNSQRHLSAYGIVDWTPIGVSVLRVGVSGGFATGYEIAPIVPVVSAVARAQIDRLSITARYLPPIHPKFTSVVALELGVRF